MASKDELQDVLKEKFGINKNVSKTLNKEECERLLDVLHSEPSAIKLVKSYAEKNLSLGRDNTRFGGARDRAERKFEALQAEHLKLKQSVELTEKSEISSQDKESFLKEEQRKLKSEVQKLSSEKQLLVSEVQNLQNKTDWLTANNIGLEKNNKELTTVKKQLEKENKDLKNIVDQIKLKLARDTKALLQYEDSEIRRAMIRLFRWTLG